MERYRYGERNSLCSKIGGHSFMEADDRDGAKMYQTAAVLAALGHKLRLRIWFTLIPYGSDGLSGSSIAAQLAVPASTLLFHLQRMVEAGVLWQTRSSHQTFYGVNWDIVDRSCDFINGRSEMPAIGSLASQPTAGADDILGC